MTQQEYTPTPENYSEMAVAIICLNIREIGDEANNYTKQQLLDLLETMNETAGKIVTSLARVEQ